MPRVRTLQYAIGEAPRWLYFHLDESPGTVPVGMFCWLVEGADQTILVDTGATKRDTQARYGGRYNFAGWRDPVEVVAQHVSPDEIETIVVTHAHWDHLSPCLERYPNARVLLQCSELEARLDPPHPSFRDLCFADYIDTLQARLGDRLVLVDGDAEVAPGVTVIHVGGHTLGSQAVLVETGKGKVCIAGDLVPAYENIENDLATSLHEDLLQCYEGMAKIRDFSHVVLPGHDRHVLRRHPEGYAG